MLFLKIFSYFNCTESANNFYIFKEIHNSITLSLPESTIKTIVDRLNVLEHFSAEILNNLKLYEEHT